MKRVLLIFAIMFIVTGCTDINKLKYNNIIDDVIKENKNNKYYNQFHKGYKYYLPKYMSNKDVNLYNELLNGGDYTYYLHVDVISYYNKVNNKYEENTSYISYLFNYNGINGYLEVNEINGKYLVEIIYNYAKIEVMVEKIDINEAINNSIIILSTIKYNDDIIKNIIGDNDLNNQEEVLNIFGNNIKGDDLLDIIEEYDSYDEETEVPDYDVIN